MRKPKTAQPESLQAPGRWNLRDGLAAIVLFAASAAVALWQNAHLAVLWDASYTLETSARIALGQMPYRDFPLVHSPFTFLIQAAIIRLTGRVYFHHILYAAIVNGLAALLAWRIVLRTLRGRLRTAWFVSLLLAAPLIPLGVYSILPFPSYDCDSAFAILIAVFLLQRLPKDSAASNSLLRFFLAGAALTLPLLFKQNIGLPFLAAAFALILLLMLVQKMRRASISNLGALLAGTITSLTVATLLLHFSAGVHNYLHWTIQFASERRLPGLQLMLSIYEEPLLLWWLPCIAVALALLHTRWVPHPFRVICEKDGIARHCLCGARVTALALLAAPFLWTLFSLFLSTDADDRAESLLALWPLLLILSAALTLWNFCRQPSPRSGLPILLLAAIQGTFLSQQLWGSTYAIWPLLMVLIAEMIAFLASIEAAGSATEATPRRFLLAPALAAIVSVALLLCGGLYTLSEERLSYARVLDEGPVVHSNLPALRGLSVSGPYLPQFEELLRFAEKEIPPSDGIILIPGEDP
ncbi:MAG: hypothetical protein ABR991_02295, partial [Terracidiphilus sp.]